MCTDLSRLAESVRHRAPALRGNSWHWRELWQPRAAHSFLELPTTHDGVENRPDDAERMSHGLRDATRGKITRESLGNGDVGEDLSPTGVAWRPLPAGASSLWSCQGTARVDSVANLSFSSTCTTSLEEIAAGKRHDFPAWKWHVTPPDFPERQQ